MATSSSETAQLQYEKSHINDTHVPQLIASFAVSLFLAYSAIVLRLTSRRLSRTQLGWDDWIIVLSLIFTNTFIFCDLGMLPIGYGRHEILVTNPTAISKVTLAAEIMYTSGILSFKASALCLLQRIFPGRRFRQGLWAIGSFVLAYSLVQTFAVIFECTPIKMFWDQSVKGRCINANDVILVCSSLNIATDVIILAMPMPKLWKLQISRTEKMQLSIIFALGGSVCVISIVRTTQIQKLSLIDPSYSDYGTAITSALEMAIGTLSACLPTYRPILHRILKGRTIDSKNGASTSHGLQISKFSRSPHTDTNASSVRPFNRLEETHHMFNDWTSSTPLADLTHTTITSEQALGNNVDTDLGLHEIRKVMDFEQRSN